MLGFAIYMTFCFAVGMSSISYAIVTEVREFQVAEVPPGSELCALDAPSYSLSFNSALECALECQRSSDCENFSYSNMNKTCDIFFNRPKCYGPSPPCIHYQAQPDQPYTGIPAENCSLPFTYGGRLYNECAVNLTGDGCNACLIANQTLSHCIRKQSGIEAEECYIPFTFDRKLYYECGSNLTGKGCLNCLVHNRTLAKCQQPSYFQPILSLTNITVPTFSTSVPLMIINRWIVVSSRIFNSINFNRSWAEYRSGFGDPTLNNWIGLEKMHQLTYSSNYRLRFEFMSVENGSWFSAEYDSIRIDPESNWYAIHVDGYSGDAGDAMNKNPPLTAYQNHKNFSTYDSDNDLSGPASCSLNHGSGWWLASCGICDLNAGFGSVSYYWKPIMQLGLGMGSKLNGSRIMFKLA